MATTKKPAPPMAHKTPISIPEVRCLVPNKLAVAMSNKTPEITPRTICVQNGTKLQT